MASATVLVVEDEVELADLYVEWLSDAYEVRTAYTAEDGRALLGEEIDVALVDRRLPDDPGDTLVDAIDEMGLDCRVAMVTAVDPDFDILDLGFDDYVVKPVSRDDLHELVEGLLSRSQYSEDVRRYYSLVSKQVALSSGKPEEELAENDEYQALLEEMNALETQLSDRLDDLDEQDFTALFHEL